MSGVLESQPEIVYSLLLTMETEKLLLPWGMVESFSKDLEPAPLMGSLSAAFESIGAYHLWAKAAGKRDYIFRAAEYCPFTWEAARAFFPSTSRW